MKLPSWFSAAATALATAFLPACDSISLQELKPGVSTVSEIRARMGQPTGEYANTDGTLTLEYSRQPEGTNCYMLTLGPDQVLQKIEQVLTDATYAKVTVGMGREEIRRLLGKPAKINTYMKPEEVWDWRIAGVIPTEEKHFHVHFDPATGKVVGTSSRVEMK